MITIKMDAQILLGKILQRFKDKGFSQVDGYNRFGYIRETDKAVYVTRERGSDTPIPFNKITKGIEAYRNKPQLYNEGPSSLRDYDITHVTSPVWSLLHLLKKAEYR